MSDSYWLQTTPDAGCPALTKPLEGAADAVLAVDLATDAAGGPLEVDVAIIGGGLTGLHAALKILEEDQSKKVVLIEADQICSDSSGRTMGKLATSHSRVFQKLSAETGKIYVKACKEGFDSILDIIETYAIDCDFKPTANYIFASKSTELEQIKKDYESMRASGLAVEWVQPRNEESEEIPFEFLAGIRQANQAVYHPRKFALGLLQAIQALGGSVHEHTVATDIAEHDRGVTISLDGGGTLEAKKAIVATRVGLGMDEPFMNYISPWRRHLIASEPVGESINNAYIRYEKPVSSLRSNGAHLLFSGGDADALPFEDSEHYKALEAGVKNAFLNKDSSLITKQSSRWWGEDVDSEDMLPLIGSYQRDSKHIFMVTGFCGWGTLKAAFAGIMLADLVAGRASPYQEHFDPWRFIKS